MTLENFVRELSAGTKMHIETADGQSEVYLERNNIGKVSGQLIYFDGEMEVAKSFSDCRTTAEILKACGAVKGLEFEEYKSRAELKTEIKRLKSEKEKLEHRLPKFSPWSWE